MLCIFKKIRKKNRILAKTNEKKKAQTKRDLQKLRIFFMIFSSSYRLYANNSLSLSLTSSTTCCTKLKLWQVWKYMYVDGSSLIIRLTYRIPCRQCSGPEWKEKALKKSTSYVGKVWNAYFSLSPTGIAISCITFSSGGKFATPVKKK